MSTSGKMVKKWNEHEWNLGCLARRGLPTIMVHASIFWAWLKACRTQFVAQTWSTHVMGGMQHDDHLASESQKEHTNKMNSHQFHLWQSFHQQCKHASTPHLIEQNQLMNHKANTSATHWMTTWTCHSFHHIWIHALSVNIKRHSLLNSDTQWHHSMHKLCFSCTQQKGGGERTLSTSNHEFNSNHFFHTKQNQTLILLHCAWAKHNASGKKIGCCCACTELENSSCTFFLPQNMHCWFGGGEAISFLLSSVSTKNDKQQLFWNNVLFLSTHKLPHSHNCISNIIPKKLFIKEIAQSFISTTQNKSDPKGMKNDVHATVCYGTVRYEKWSDISVPRWFEREY